MKLNTNIDYSSPETHREILDRFTYHFPRSDQPVRYELIRDNVRAVADLIDRICPPSREKSCALTYLQEAVMWANAAIAIREHSAESHITDIPAGTPD